MILSGIALLCLQAAAGEPVRKRQIYNVPPEKAKENARLVNADLEKIAPEWKKAPAVFYTVDAMSDIRRVPELYPVDGKIAAPLEYIGAKGEYEAGSFLVYPMKNVDKLDFEVSPLKNKSGAVIPASAIDLKIMKVWYQAGSAWHGYFADALGRLLVPELLLNDESIIYADPETQDNYILYKNKDGSESYFWASASFMVTNYAFSNQVNIALVSDAPTLQSAVLNKGEFKQFFATLHIPSDAKEGIYKGTITMKAEGRKFGEIPVTVRVLPFELPVAKTNYNPDKGFYLCLYGTSTENPKILKNLAAHNGHTMGMPNITPFTPENFEKQVKLMNETGVPTRPIFAGSAGAGITINSDAPTPADLKRLSTFKREIEETGELCKKVLGHTDFYSYGVDEGGAGTIRAERQAWKTAHDAGGKVMVTSFPHRRLLFALDYLIIPGAPVDRRVNEVAKFHESNPDSLCGWYANPHSGPENRIISAAYTATRHGNQITTSQAITAGGETTGTILPYLTSRICAAS